MTSEAANAADWQQDKTFPPPPEFAAAANVRDPEVYARAAADPEAFWAGWAAQLELVRAVAHRVRVESAAREVVPRRQAQRRASTAWTGTSTGRGAISAPSSGRASRATSATLTFAELSAKSTSSPTYCAGWASARAIASPSTCRWCPKRRSPCWPARVSARSTPSSSAASRRRACAERTKDCASKLVITADGYWRRGKSCRSSTTTDEALPHCPTVENVIVLQARRRQRTLHMRQGRDHWWHDLMAEASRGMLRRTDGRRGPALYPLHLRQHRQAQGHPPHHGRLPDRRLRHHASGSSTSRTTISTGVPPTSAGSRATPTSSTARSPTA